MRQVSLICVILLTAVIVLGCTDEPATYEIEVGDATFEVEVVADPDSRARGLMYRDEMAPDAGMLFMFPESAPRSFWMRNTLIPLSIAYIDSRLVVREIHDMTPHDLTPVVSSTAAQYALEVNQGAFERLGVRVGDVITLPARLTRQIEVY